MTENLENLLDINKFNCIYNAIFLKSGAGPKHLASNYNKKIKELVENNIPNLAFVKSKLKNKPQRLVPTLTQEEAVRLNQETITDENYMKSLWK